MEINIEELCSEITNMLSKVKILWIKDYLQDLYKNITCKNKKLLSGALLPILRVERNNLFKALMFTDCNGGNIILERVFSIRCFGNSKQFEKMRKRFVDIIKKYADCENDASEEDLLRIAGIVRYSEQFEFHGPLMLHFTGGVLDFSLLDCGASLNVEDFKRGKIHIPSNVANVISIENFTNYFDYIKKQNNKNEIVIYHGGFCSPSKVHCFKAVAMAVNNNCLWHHWGDIDYSGFSMLLRLRREIKNDVRPYRMSLDELIKYETYTEGLHEDYIEKLKQLKEHDELSDCQPCLKYMIKNKVKLEQEAML
jgi:hypothetical protein